MPGSSGLRSDRNRLQTVASVMESQKDEAETASGTDPSVDESTDLVWMGGVCGGSFWKSATRNACDRRRR